MRFDNHNLKLPPQAKFTLSVYRKRGITGPGISSKKNQRSHRYYISNIISPRIIATFHNAILRKIASVFSPYKNHSRHERFVQSRAIWVLSRVDSLSFVPARRFFHRFSKNGFNSCFCFSARDDVGDVSPGY